MTEIMDKNFKKYIEQLFKKPIENVTQDDYDSITEINCKNLQIKNLQGIENFTNLKLLDCSCNEFVIMIKIRK